MADRKHRIAVALVVIAVAASYYIGVAFASYRPALGECYTLDPAVAVSYVNPYPGGELITLDLHYCEPRPVYTAPAGSEPDPDPRPWQR